MWLHVLCRVAHVVYGLLSALAVRVNPVLTVVMAAVFIIYELDEEWRLNDVAYEELREFMLGFSIGVVVMLI
jgi:hypothetical protein